MAEPIDADERLPQESPGLSAALDRVFDRAERIQRAAPFVNAVAVMAEDKGPALAWIADAAAFSTQHQPEETP